MSRDYCTFSPEGNWGGTCCKKHDDDYENVSCGKSRLQADWDLAKCITKSAPHWSLRPFWGIIGGVYFTGVRVFGSSHVKKYCDIKSVPVWKDPDIKNI